MKMGEEHQEEAAAAAAASNTTQDSSAVASSNLFMMMKNDELDGMGEAAAPQFYYYQNPTTGTVSQTPLAVAQLVKLLVPVREGIKAILPPHTQCLAVGNAANTPTKRMEEDEEGDEGEATTTATSFGEWKPVSTVNVLKEAACAQWYLTGGPTQSSENGEGESSKAEEEAPAPAPAGTQGPMTCRSLLDAYHQVTDQSKVLVFAPEITSEWTPIDKLPRLQLVLQALQPMPPPPPSFHSLPDASSDSVAQNDEHIRNDDDNDDDDVAASATIQDELEAFLSSTAAGGGGGANGNDDEDDDDDDDQAYESDGGTRYVKDPLSGHWIHEALAPPRPEPKNSSKQSSSQNKKSTTANNNKNPSSKKSHKKAKFSKRNARNWIYVTGLPTTPGHVDVAQVHKFFGKVGLLDLDPETLQPKLKLYKSSDGNGSLKGDASLCYARPESVELALQVLDESPWDEHHTIRIQRAKFEAKTEDDENDDDDDDDEKDAQTTTTTKKKKRGDKRKRERKTISQAQRKVARLALLQAQDEGFGERLAGGRKGLRIVVVKHMLDGIPEPDWESTIQDYCQSLEEDVTVEKITCISKTKVVIVKFVEPSGASQAVEAWNGKVNAKSTSLGQGANKTKSMEAFYWDGVTDYTDSHEEHNPDEEAKRHEDFGKWLDDQGESELPPELRLQVAEG